MPCSAFPGCITLHCVFSLFFKSFYSLYLYNQIIFDIRGWYRCKSPFRNKCILLLFLERFEYLCVFILVLFEEKSCPTTSLSKFLMNLLCRQSQNLCPKNAKPVFTGCCRRLFLSIWAVSFALRVNTMLIFRSDEFPLISLIPPVSQKPINWLFPHLPNFPFLVYLKITSLSGFFTEEQDKGEGEAYLDCYKEQYFNKPGVPVYFLFVFRFLRKNPCPFNDLRKAQCADNMHLKEHLLKETRKFTSFCLSQGFFKQSRNFSRGRNAERTAVFFSVRTAVLPRWVHKRSQEDLFSSAALCS